MDSAKYLKFDLCCK